MLNRPITSFLGIILALGCWTSAVNADEIAWHTKVQEAHRESRASGRPMLVYVGADFCFYCRKLERKTWADSSISQLIARSFVPLHLDGDRDSRLVEQLGVSAFPCVVILSPEPRIIKRAEGFQRPDDMRTFLTCSLEQRN